MDKHLDQHFCAGQAGYTRFMRIFAWLALTLVGACAPFQSGGLFNPIRAVSGQAAVLPPAGSAFVQYSQPFGLSPLPDLAPAYVQQYRSSLGGGRSVMRQEINYTARPGFLPEGWSAQIRDVSVRAEVERRLEQTSFNEVTRWFEVGRSSAVALVRVTSPVGAQNVPFSLGIAFVAEGSSFPIQLGVRTLNGLIVSSEDSPVRVGNGDSVGVPPGSTVWFEVSLGVAVADYLASGLFRRLGNEPSSSLSVPLRNLSIRFDELPQGLSWNNWNCEARGLIRQTPLGRGRQVLQLDPSEVSCFSEVGLAQGWQPGNVRGQIVSNDLIAPINFFVQKGQ